jgi:peptide/nickel transport system substrate-binding protein
MSTITVIKRSAMLLATAGATLGLAACGGDDKSDTTAAAPSTGATTTSAGAPTTGAAKAGKLIVADATVADSLDPDGPSASVQANLTATNNTYDNLVTWKSAPNPADLGGGNTIDADGFAPALAESWKQDDKGVTVTLRKGVKSQYGNELTADDVVWSYDRSEGVNATGKFIYDAIGGVTGAEKVGKYQVHFSSKGAAPLLLAALAQPYTKIYDSTEVKKHVTGGDKWASKWLAANTAGFGAYTVGNFASGRSLQLTPSETYWNGTPENAITLTPIPDASNRYAALDKGDINMALGLTPQQDEEATKNSNLHVYRVKGNQLVTLFPNLDVPAFKNPKVRQALQYATPQDDIVNQVYKGFGFPIKSIATAYAPGYTDKHWPYTYDLAKAKSLMQEAGFGDGVSTDLSYASESQTMAQLAPILQSSYEQIGIKLKLKPEPASTLVTRAFGDKDIPLWLTDTASSVIPDIGNAGALYSTGGFANVNGYSNAEYDATAKEALGTNDQAARMPSFDKLQAIAAEDPPIIAVAGLESVVSTSGNVGGFSWQPDGSQKFATLTVGSAES